MAAEDKARLRVTWVGAMPEWLAAEEAAAALQRVEISTAPLLESGGSGFPLPDALPQVVHVGRSELDELGRLKGAPGCTLVLDLTADGEEALRRRQAHRAEAADLILVGSLAELRELRRRFPSLAPRTALLRRPVDLETYTTESALLERRNRDIRRFRSFHRLAGPTVLFAGPFTNAGGLDLALDAVQVVRERIENVRLTAIPVGPTDSRYLDRCERKALALGHHGVIEWAPRASELPLWYGTATVVCLPCRESVASEPARLAAAAGKPVVGTEVESLLEHVVDGQTGYLVPVGNLAAIVSALEALLGNQDEAARLGATARQTSELWHSPAATARQLLELWTAAVERSFERAASTNGHF